MGSCERGNEFSGFIKSGIFLSNHQLYVGIIFIIVHCLR
jgi:hypothetical protein